MLISTSGGETEEAEDIDKFPDEFPDKFPEEFPEELPDEDKCPEDIFIPCPEFTGVDITGAVENVAALAAAAMAVPTCGPKWAAKYGAKVWAGAILNCCGGRGC